MKLSDEATKLFRTKSEQKKLYFSIHKGRKQVSMLLDNAEQGDLLKAEIGGTVAVKVRSYPVGAKEWFYHGDDIVDLCTELLPLLNWFQCNYVSKWL